MPSRNIIEEERESMAKFLEKVEVKDRTIPVQVNMRKPGGSTEGRLFPADGEKTPMDQFDAWYDPKVYHYVGQIEDGSVTMINLEHVEVEAGRKARPPSRAVVERGRKIIADREKAERREAREKRKRERGETSREPRERSKGDGVSGSIAVEAGGKAFGTLVTAFKKLGLNMAERKDFRRELIKADGAEVTYKRHGKTVVFRWLKDGKPAKEEAAPAKAETAKPLAEQTPPKLVARAQRKAAKEEARAPTRAQAAAAAKKLAAEGHTAPPPKGKVTKESVLEKVRAAKSPAEREAEARTEKKPGERGPKVLERMLNQSLGRTAAKKKAAKKKGGRR